MPRRLSPRHFVLTRRPAVSAGQISAPRIGRFSNFSERARRERGESAFQKSLLERQLRSSSPIRWGAREPDGFEPGIPFAEGGALAREKARAQTSILYRRARTSRRRVPSQTIGPVHPGLFHAPSARSRPPRESIQVAPIPPKGVSEFPSTGAGIRFFRPSGAVQKV